MTDPQLLSSKRSDWETPGTLDDPDSFFGALHKEFNFDLDAAAHEMNAKLDNFLTEDDDALTIDWPGVRPWVNCPYGKGTSINKWCETFARMAMRKDTEHLVALLAARTDTLWFHELIWTLADEVRLIKGRLLFEIDGEPIRKQDKKGVWRNQPATFPSMIVVWRRKPLLRSDDGPLFRQMLPSGKLLEEPPL